jgi:hypothetical protein
MDLSYAQIQVRKKRYGDEEIEIDQEGDRDLVDEG